MKVFFIGIFTFALIIVLGGLIYSVSGDIQPAKKEPEILSFEAGDSKLITRTRDIASVGVFGVMEDGISTTTEGDIMLSDVKQAVDGKREQSWELPLPSKPLLVSTVYVVGYDREGNEVAQKTLPYAGSSELVQALWGDQDSKETDNRVVLTIGSSTVIDGSTITLTEVVSDSLCEETEDCEMKGLKAILSLSGNTQDAESNGTTSISFSTDGITEGVTITPSLTAEIARISPQQISEETGNQQDFQVELVFTKES